MALAIAWPLWLSIPTIVRGFRMSSLALPVSPPVSYNHISCKVNNSLSNQTKVDFGFLIGSQPYPRSVLRY
ncbi:unnamed protein product [Moneuplotes crassus]|uniref:Secreted protein n=1 Tax=Euplotes crassus TaxID=5936 RepID=A0AAD1XXC7_EUPCR|nr:unnamed protein product [Moneuplotes crassus]